MKMPSVRMEPPVAWRGPRAIQKVGVPWAYGLQGSQGTMSGTPTDRPWDRRQPRGVRGRMVWG